MDLEARVFDKSVRIKPTKKLLKGILDDPEFFRIGRKWKPKKRDKQFLSYKMKKVLSLMEQGVDLVEAYRIVYPTAKLESITKKITHNKEFKHAIDMIMERVEEVKMDTKSEQVALNADTSLARWERMYQIAEVAGNVKVMMEAQDRIDKIINAQEGYKKSTEKGKRVFTEDVASDESWKEEFKPIFDLLKAKGVDLSKVEPPTPEKKTRGPRKKHQRAGKSDNYTKTVSIPELLRPITNAAGHNGAQFSD